jgi:hypothetical protein
MEGNHRTARAKSARESVVILRVSERCSKSPSGLLKHRVCNAIALTGCQTDVFGSKLSVLLENRREAKAGTIFCSFCGDPQNPRSAGDCFQATFLPTSTKQSIGINAKMSDLTSSAGLAAVQFSAANDGGADSGCRVSRSENSRGDLLGPPVQDPGKALSERT